MDGRVSESLKFFMTIFSQITRPNHIIEYHSYFRKHFQESFPKLRAKNISDLGYV